MKNYFPAMAGRLSLLQPSQGTHLGCEFPLTIRIFLSLSSSFSLCLSFLVFLLPPFFLKIFFNFFFGDEGKEKEKERNI